MASKATQALTTGMKILGGADIPTYTLEFLTPAGKHQKGSYVSIAVPYAKLGRSSGCTVSFGEENKTVSREHAAIERKGTDVFIVNLSGTNPTLVNGRPVNNKYYLNNGDEIQLSMEGPRIRYNETNTGTAKMGFTNRMNLVMQQSIKPYKTAAISFLIVFVMILAGSGYLIYDLTGQLEDQKLLTAQLEESTSAKLAEYSERSETLSKELDRYKAKSDSLLKLSKNNKTFVELIEPLKGNVLALSITKIDLSFAGKSQTIDVKDRVNCTGFLIDGGTFVTARHCIDSGLTDELTANFIQHNGGKVTYHYTAQSYDDKIKFDFTNHDLEADYSMDKMVDKSLKIGSRRYTGKIRIPDYFRGADWAYMKTRYSKGVPFNKALSQKLRAGTELLVLGYSYGTRFRKSGNLEPYFSTAKVTLSGIQDGTVHVSEAGWDGGNSGGPVFAIDNTGKAVAVGLVTGSFRKPEQTQGEDVVYVNAGIKMLTPLANF